METVLSQDDRFSELSKTLDRQVVEVLEADVDEDEIASAVESLVTTAAQMTVHARDDRSRSDLQKIMRISGAIAQGTERAFREVEISRTRNFIEARKKAVQTVQTLKTYVDKYERDQVIEAQARAVNRSRLIGGLR